MLRLIAQYTCSPTVSPLLAELNPISGIRIPLCRAFASTGWVTYGSHSSGMFLTWKTLPRARAFSPSTLNSEADSSQSGFSNWHDVTVPP